ncbi:MAG: serine/threonine-protein kinase, partial [Planctomycetota bacterium]
MRDERASARPLADMIAETRAQVEDVSRLPPREELVRGYRLIREIHRGGQGVVYLAHHAATDRNVALKVMRQGPLAGVGERARFEREIQILASIKHPNIVAIHDSGSERGNDFFVMDYIEGKSFDDWADQVVEQATDSSKSFIAVSSGGRGRIVRALIKIADAVAVAHQRGIIHRDIKPSNLRVDEHDQPFVLDFGLAKAVASGDTDDGAHQLT